MHASRAGSSALSLALSLRNNAIASTLLLSGASRATLSRSPLIGRNELSNSTADQCTAATEVLSNTTEQSWLGEQVRRMLSPAWSLVWTPALHPRFAPDQREKCRLVVMVNQLALRRSSGADSDERPQQLLQRCMVWLFQDPDVVVRWRYLPWSIVHHILEYAVFLW